MHRVETRIFSTLKVRKINKQGRWIQYMIISFLKSTEKQSNKFVDCRFELKSNGWFVFKNKTMANKGTFGKVLTKSLGIQKRVHSTFVTDTQAVSSLWVSSQWILWLLTYHVLLWCVYLTLRKRFLPFVNYQYSCLYISW